MANPFINLKKQQDEDNKQEQPKATTGNPFVDLPKQPAQQQAQPAQQRPQPLNAADALADVAGRITRAAADKKGTDLNKQRSSLMNQLQTVQDSAAYITDPDAANANKAEERRIINQLNVLDKAQGNADRYYSNADRAGGVLRSWGDRTAGSYLSTAAFGGQLAEAQDETGRAIADSAYAGYATDPLAIENMRRAVEQNGAPESIGVFKTNREMLAKADELLSRGERESAKVYEGAGKADRILADLATGALDLGADSLASAILPGSGLFAMGARTFGQGTYEQRKEGGSLGKQFLNGAKSAAIEILTEKIGGPFEKIYGNSMTGKAVNAFISRFDNPIVQRGLSILSGAFSEGVEEFLSDVLNPVADRLLQLDDGTGKVFKEGWLQNALYDALIGGILGALGEGVKVAPGQRNAPSIEAAKDNAVRGALEAVDRAVEEQAQTALEQDTPQAPQEAAGEPVPQGGTEIAPTGAETPTAAPVELNSQERVEEAEQSAEAEQSIDERARRIYETPYEDEFSGTQQREDWGSSGEGAKLWAYLEANGVDSNSLTEGSGAESRAFYELLDLLDHGGDLQASAAAQAFAEAKANGKMNIPEIVSRAYEIAGKEMPSGVRSQYAPTPQDRADRANLDERYAKEMASYFDTLAKKAEREGNTEYAERMRERAAEERAKAKEAARTAAEAAAQAEERAAETEAPAAEESAGTAETEADDQQTPTEEQPSNRIPYESRGRRGGEAQGSYEELGERYGTIEPGENPARESAVPKQIDDQRKVGKTARTMYEAAAIPDNRLDDISNAVVDGKFSYIPISNKALATEAENRVKRDGWDAALRDFLADVRSGKTGDRLEALGAVLINNAANSGMDGKAFVDLAMAYDQLTHNTARGLAAARILKSLTPTAQIYRIQKTVNRMNDELQERWGKKEAKEQKKREKQSAKNKHSVNPAKDNVPWFMWAEKSGQAVADSMAKKLKEAGITKPVKVKTVAQQAEADIKKVLRAYSHTKSRNINAEALENILNNPQFANDLYQELRESLVKKSKLSEEEIADLGEDWIQESLYDVLAQMAGKSNEIHLDEKLVDEFLKADSDESRDEILDRIKQNIADQIPPTFRDKFVALRYLNMLGNFKTQGRNVFGNVFMITTAMLKNHIVRGTMEGIAQAASGGKYQANTSVFYNPALLKETMADFNNVEKIALGEQKYGDVGSNYEKDIDEKRRIFRSKTLEGYRKLTKWAMEAGDKVFSKAAYADAMAGWMQAHKVKHISDMTPEMLDRARAFAIKEAQEATFRDSNKFSNWASSIGRGENVPAAVKAVAEGTLPFRKTPANVLARAFEYSPAGVFSVIEKSIQAAKGNATGSDVVNALSKSFTGTGLFAVGMLLKAIGSLRTRDDDEKLENFHKDQGMQNYSLVLPDGKTVTLDWVAPASIPLFMGAMFQQIREEGGISGDNLLSVVTQLTEPMLEMSMLSGVNDALELSTGYGNNRLQALPSLCLNALAGYMTQGLGNSLIRQGEQAWEKNRRTSYTDSSLPIPTALQRKGSQLFSGIPGMDIQQQDYIDVWGRKQDQGSTGERILQSFFNPAYIGKDRSTKYDGELERLYKAGFKAALPKAPERSTDVNGERLTPEEYQTYAEKAGKKKLELIGDFLDSEEYKKLSDKDREAVISNLYSYANHLAAKDIVKMRGEKMKETNHVKSMEKLRELDKNGGSAVDYLLAKQGLKTAVDAKDYSGVDALLGDVDKMDKATKEQLFADVNRLDDRVESHKAGIDTVLWEAAYAQKKKLEKDKSTTAVQDAISFAQWADSQKDLNRKQKDLLRDQMGFYITFRADPEKFDQLTGTGLSADKAGKAWNAINALEPLEGKKTVSAAQKVQAISGMSYLSEAEKWAAFGVFLAKSNESLYKKAMKAKDSGKSFDQWAKEYAGSSGSSSGSDALSFITGGGSSGSSSGSSSGGDALSFITGGRG